MFLILRCRPSDALSQAESMRSNAIGLTEEDIVCPSYRVERRVGRNRDRIEMDVPVLGNFIFMRWDSQSLYYANYIERVFPFVSIMRLPHGGYATCSDKEVNDINKLLPSIPADAEIPTFEVGTKVQVIRGTFLSVIEGVVLSCKKNGEVKLRVTKSGNLKLATLLISGSLLTAIPNASVEAPGDECLTPSR